MQPLAVSQRARSVQEGRLGGRLAAHLAVRLDAGRDATEDAPHGGWLLLLRGLAGHLQQAENILRCCTSADGAHHSAA